MPLRLTAAVLTIAAILAAIATSSASAYQRPCRASLVIGAPSSVIPGTDATTPVSYRLAGCSRATLSVVTPTEGTITSTVSSNGSKSVTYIVPGGGSYKLIATLTDGGRTVASATKTFTTTAP